MKPSLMLSVSPVLFLLWQVESPSLKETFLLKETEWWWTSNFYSCCLSFENEDKGYVLIQDGLPDMQIWLWHQLLQSKVQIHIWTTSLLLWIYADWVFIKYQWLLTKRQCWSRKVFLLRVKTHQVIYLQKRHFVYLMTCFRSRSRVYWL